MAHFALLDENNIVVQVYPGTDKETEQQLSARTGKTYKKCSYHTKGGIYYHKNPETGVYEPSPDQTKAFRKNYPHIGAFYDENKDAFIPTKPFDSWILNEEKCLWFPPVGKEMPDDSLSIGSFIEVKWSEEKQEWICKDGKGNPATFDRTINKWRFDNITQPDDNITQPE